LQTLAFQVLANDDSMQASAATRIKMIQALAKASGSQGMVGGQAIDLESVGKKLTLPELENMHIHKTGALIRVAVQLCNLLGKILLAGKRKSKAFSTRSWLATKYSFKALLICKWLQSLLTVFI
jgi:geranylgeranyl pyrophosphate synthase